MNQRNRKNVPIFVVLISILLIVIVIAVAGSGGGSSVTVKQYEPVIPETTKVLTPASTQYLSSISPDGTIFTFSQTSSEIEQIKLGDVIVSEGTSVAPYGFLQRVINISQSGEQVVIQTEPASLTDAIESGTIRISKKLTQADLAYIQPQIHISNMIASNALYSMVPPNLLDDKLFFKFNDLAVWDDDGNLSTTDDQVRVNGEIAFNPEFNLDFSWNKIRLDGWVFTTGGELDANVSLVAGGKIKGSKDVVLQTFRFNPIIVFVGHVPVVIVPVIDLIAHIEVSLEGGLKLDFSWKLNNSITVSWNRGTGWDYDSNSSRDFSQNFRPTLKGKLVFYPDPYLRLLLYNTVGISTAFRPYVKAIIDPFADPCWELSAGLKVPVGIQGYIFDKKLADFNVDVIGYEISIAKSQSACFVTMTETSPPSVTQTASIGTPIPSITGTVINSESPSNSSTAMLFDVSGSMEELDFTGITKLDAAKDSGSRILDIIQAENSVSQGAEIAILSFSDAAWVNSSLTLDVEIARSALYSLYPMGGTGMPDGLRLAIDQFTNSQNTKPIIIMLSDGMPNIGLGGVDLGDESLVRQQALDLASEAGTKGICIYTVGFGIPETAGSISGEASIDEDFLKQVATNSGCGAYYNAQNATELANVYVNLRHQSTGNILLNQTGNIAQGQTVDIGDVQVPDNQTMILFTLNWPGSQLDAILMDPTGKIVNSNYPKSFFSLTDTLASIIIQDPQPGQWKVSARGVDVPEGVTTYNAVISARPNPNPPTALPQETPAFPVVIIILAIASVGVATYVMTQTRTRKRLSAPAITVQAQLIAIHGEKAGQAFLLSDRLVTGRGSRCALQLKEQTISRQHAIFRFSSGHWYVQDMNSKTGTYVNDTRVNAKILKNGDHIRIGSNVFEFHSGR